MEHSFDVQKRKKNGYKFFTRNLSSEIPPRLLTTINQCRSSWKRNRVPFIEITLIIYVCITTSITLSVLSGTLIAMEIGISINIWHRISISDIGYGDKKREISSLTRED